MCRRWPKQRGIISWTVSESTHKLFLNNARDARKMDLYAFGLSLVKALICLLLRTFHYVNSVIQHFKPAGRFQGWRDSTVYKIMSVMLHCFHLWMPMLSCVPNVWRNVMAESTYNNKKEKLVQSKDAVPKVWPVFMLMEASSCPLLVQLP